MTTETDDDLIDGVAGEEFDTTKEPKSSRAWLAVIADAEKAFSAYHDSCENVDKRYATLERLGSVSRDREFQMFWANIQVLGPSVYSRPPVPVVVPRFKDKRPLARTTSELLERSAIVGFELSDIDAVMRLVRDDLTIISRGCAWVRYETKAESAGPTERVCIEHVDRKDFLHEQARNWSEVDWVAKRSFLTKRAMRKRFKKTSGDAYKDAAYEARKDDDADDGTLKAAVWEIWSKSRNRVVWVSEGAEVLLDDDKPHLDLEGFFPCPRPAYATTQRRSLVPVPDMVFYKDQLEEINELTTRIGALSEAVKLRGFYPSGAGDISDAIEAAIKRRDESTVLFPVSNWAMMGQGGVKDMIVWLPLDMIVQAITQLIEMRRQLIDDVYQITGLSDIMRGSTVASETLGAQQLKSQYGSIRIRDRQDELVRFARDITRISAEIMAEHFDKKTLVDMAQMEIPTDSEIKDQIKPLKQQFDQITGMIQKAMSDPETQALAKQHPEEAKQAMEQAHQQAGQLEQQITKLRETVTVEKVMSFLKDQRLRPFVLDIETDSTITPDENAQKQRATEYLTAMGGLLGQAVPAVQQLPQIAPLVADTIRFAQSQFRVGRSMDEVVEEFVEQMKSLASAPKPPDPMAAQQQHEQEIAQAEAQTKQQAAQADAQAKMADVQIRQQEAQVKAAQAAADLQSKQQADADAAQLRQIEADAKQREADARHQALIDGMNQTAVEHAQKLEIGALNIELLRAKIDQSKVSAVASAQAADAKIEAMETKAEQASEPAGSD